MFVLAHRKCFLTPVIAARPPLSKHDSGCEAVLVRHQSLCYLPLSFYYLCEWTVAALHNKICTPCRALAEEDVQGSSSSIRDAAGEEGDALMPQGAMKESGLSSTDAYLTRKAGMYCDVVERLAQNHLEVSEPI